MRFLAHLVENDHLTVHGRNLSAIAQLCNVQDISHLKPKIVKDRVSYMPVPESEKWKAALCKELLCVRTNDVEIPGFDSDEQDFLLNYLCTT